MKKTKNKVFCYGCNKEKILFETKEKAENFIRFNQDLFRENNRKTVFSSNYCRFCLGYHITTNTSRYLKRYFANKDRKEISRMRKAVNERNAYLQNKDDNIDYLTLLKITIRPKLEIIRAYMIYGLFEDAEAGIQSCLEYIRPCNWPYELKRDLRMRRGTLMKERGILNTAWKLSHSSDEEREQSLSAMDLKQQEMLREMLNNHSHITMIAKELEDIKSCLDKNETEGIKERLDICEPIMQQLLYCRKHNELIIEYRNKLSELKKLYIRLTEVPFESLKKKENLHVSASKYKRTLLWLIERINNVAEAFDNEKYMWCRNHINSSLLILDELGIKDDNTELVRKQLELWEERVDKEIEP